MNDRGAAIVIWDPLVRAFHWTLAVAFLVNYWLTEPGSDIHVVVGYIAFTAVAVRVAWGLFGSGYARFDRFGVSLSGIREHFRALRSRHIPADSGHNPVGALMIYLVLALVTVLAVSGWLHEEVDALYGNDRLQLVHEIAGHALWFCVLMHVAAVFTVQHLGRIELVRPMITGRRRLR